MKNSTDLEGTITTSHFGAPYNSGKASKEFLNWVMEYTSITMKSKDATAL